MKIDTVNVISYHFDGNNEDMNVFSFSDDAEGNAEAEKVFTDIIIDDYKEMDNDSITDYLDDGFYENGMLKVYLIHSSINN